MKHLIQFITHVLLICTFIGCSDDDNSDFQAEIVGVWNLIQVKAEQCNNDSDNFETNSAGQVFTLNSKNTYASILNPGGNEVRTSGTFSISNDQITVCTSGGDCSSESYSIDDDILILFRTDIIGCLITHRYERL